MATTTEVHHAAPRCLLRLWDYANGALPGPSARGSRSRTIGKMGAMHLAADYIRPTPRGGRCRIRIYLSEDERPSVVICTEPRDNRGMSITNAAEQLAAEVICSHQLRTPLVWIEHYEEGARGTPKDRATFDLVIFSSYEITERAPYLGEGRLSIGRPTWKALERASVETLIGGPLQEG
jgi:hypothetical protein